MSRTVRLGGAASAELRDAVRWYEEQRPGLGAELFDAVTEIFDRIADHPEVGSARGRDVQTRRLVMARFPYQVVYRLTATEIVIIAVAHLKRRPGYWNRRT